MALERKTFFATAFAFVLGSLLFAGCLSQSPTPSSAATPSPQQASVQPATPTPSTPSPSVNIEIPPTTQQQANYSKVDVVTHYLSALAAKNYASAYALVSRDFKNEDPDAASLDAFKARMQNDYPNGLGFVNANAVPNVPRDVDAFITTPNSAKLQELVFPIVFESGFWAVRIPFATPSKYYNDKTSFAYNGFEIEAVLSKAVNDYFVQFDSSLAANPFAMNVLDRSAGTYYGGRNLALLNSSMSRPTIYSTISITFGPSTSVSSFPSSSPLSDRRYYFTFTAGSQAGGGNGGFFCYQNSNPSYFVSLTIDGGMTSFFSYESNPFRPVLEALSKICPP